MLGCTHYPLVEDNIRRLYPTLDLLDPARQMAETLSRDLDARGLRNDQRAPGRMDIFTTGSLEEYIKKANRVGLTSIRSVQYLPPMQIADQPAI